MQVSIAPDDYSTWVPLQGGPTMAYDTVTSSSALRLLNQVEPDAHRALGVHKGLGEISGCRNTSRQLTGRQEPVVTVGDHNLLPSMPDQTSPAGFIVPPVAADLSRALNQLPSSNPRGERLTDRPITMRSTESPQIE